MPNSIPKNGSAMIKGNPQSQDQSDPHGTHNLFKNRGKIISPWTVEGIILELKETKGTPNPGNALVDNTKILASCRSTKTCKQTQDESLGFEHKFAHAHEHEIHYNI